jgi:regulator of sigma E protease
MSVFLLILGIILFVGLVVVHEFGHFIAARRNGVEVEEFGIGFPPRAWSRRIKDSKGGFLFSLNWLPIGGFVKLKGESDAAKEKGSLGAASTWSKTKIMLAGVIMNLVVAFGLLTVLAWTGMPQFIDNQYTVKSDAKTVRSDVVVSYVEETSPAAKAGLKTEDKIISVKGGGKTTTVQDASQIPELTKKYPGQKIAVTYERDGTTKTVNVQLRSAAEVEKSKNTDNPKGYLGIVPGEYKIVRSTWSAPIVAAGVIGQVTKLTFQGLGTALTAVFQGDGAKASEQVSGPLGIIFLLKYGSGVGFEFILMLIAIISLTLAIMNVLPIPALDGGRLYMVLLSRLSTRLGGKPMSQEMEEKIVGASFIFLLFLIILITVVDVKRFF